MGQGNGHNGRLRQRVLDSEILTSRPDRRSFLARALGVGSVAVGGLLTTACPASDPGCDADTGSDADVSRVGDPASVTDSDSGASADPPGQGRFVDADVTTVGDPPMVADTCDTD